MNHWIAGHLLRSEIEANHIIMTDLSRRERSIRQRDGWISGYSLKTKQYTSGEDDTSGGEGKSSPGDCVEKVGDEDFNRGAIVAPQQLIAGKAAGVRITSGGGAAGEGGG